MSNGLKQPSRGPDAMFASDLAPTRGQHETIARLACQLHDVPLVTRLDATTAIVRLSEALQHDAHTGADPVGF